MSCMQRRAKLRVISGAAFWLAVIAAPASYAQSFTGELDGTSYDFSTVGPASFDSLQGTLESTPWWGNATLAESAANVVEGEFGLPNFNEVGPLFVYGVTDTNALAYHFASFNPGGVATEVTFLGRDQDLVYATAAPVAVPEINGNALSLIVFILGVLALTIGGRRSSLPGGTPAGAATC